MTRRPGMTMTEVLVTIFVVVIGLTGVMSMFPFATKQMSDALVSDRSTSLATATDGLVRGYWNEKVVEGGNANTEPFWQALDDPDRTGHFHPNTTATSRLPRAQLNESSYPVFLDPMGEVGRGGTNRYWVGDTTNITYVPRRSMNLVLNTTDASRQALRLFSQADGFSWDEDSRPKSPQINAANNAAEMRELRYNALAVIQRPNNRDRFSATLKIVVFLNRRHQFYPNGSEAAVGATFRPGETVIQLPTTADIKKGSWIMDATVQTATPFIRHANFYRVVSATENTTGTYDVELHAPVRRVDGSTAAYNGTAVVVAGVAEVFERPVLTGSANP